MKVAINLPALSWNCMLGFWEMLYGTVFRQIIVIYGAFLHI